MCVSVCFVCVCVGGRSWDPNGSRARRRRGLDVAKLAVAGGKAPSCARGRGGGGARGG